MERLLETILGSFLSDYVSTSKETATGPFKAYLSSSGISLHDIEFNTSKISLPVFSIDVATAKALEVKVPWASLGAQPIEVKVSDVVLHLRDRADPSNSQPMPTTKGRPWEETCVESDEANTSGNNGTGWIGSSIQSRLLRYAVNVSIFVENLSLCICSSRDPSSSIVCQMDSLTLINIPASDWITLIDDPSLWVSKGFLIRGFRVCFEKNGVSLASVRVDSMQISGLVPMFALLEEDSIESNRIVPVSIDIHSLEILGSDDMPRLVERYYDLFPWKPEALKKSIPTNSCEFLGKDMKLLYEYDEKINYPWRFDVGISIDKPLIGINLTNLPLKPTDPAFLELRFGNIMCHLELNEGSRNFNAMVDYFEAVLLDKVDVEFCICKIASNGAKSKALIGSVEKSIDNTSYELHIEDLILNVPVEIMKALPRIRTLPSGLETEEASRAETCPKFDIHVSSMDIGLSFQGSSLSLLIDSLSMYGTTSDFTAASTASIVLTSADDQQTPHLCRYLSNRVHLDLRVSNSITKLMCTRFSFCISGVETLQKVIVLLNGSCPKSFSKYAILNQICPSLEVEIGSKRRPFLLNKSEDTVAILTDFKCHIAGGEHQIFAMADLSFLKSDESLQLKIGKSVLKLSDASTDEIINIMIGNSVLQKKTQKQSLFIRSVVADVKILAFDMTPLFALLECLASLVKRPSIESQACETELRMDYAVITSSEVDHHVLSFWSRGLLVMKKTDHDNIVVKDAGVDLFSGDERAAVLELKRELEECALSVSKHFPNELLGEQEVQISAFHVALQPVLLRLLDGILVIKNSISNSLKNGTFLINPSHLVSRTYRKMTTQIRFGLSTVVLGPGKFSEKGSLGITLKGITMQYVQESLTKDRPWFLDIVQGETESKLLVSVETIVTNVPGDCPGKTFNIILPFSMAMSLHMWPIDSKKHLHLSTSPIIFQIRSPCWENLYALCDLYKADRSQLVEVARNNLLEGVAKDDLRCMPSIFLPGGSMSDLTRELHIELLVQNITLNSISWTYRNPRSIKRISFKGTRGQFLHPMQLCLYSSDDAGASKCICFPCEQDLTEHSIQSADYSNSWTLQWDPDLDKDSLATLIQSISIFSESCDGMSSESWDMGFEYESQRVSFLLFGASCPLQPKARTKQWRYNLLGEVSLRCISLSFQIWESAKFIELSASLSMEYTDPFDGCSLTLLRPCAVKVSYYSRTGGELVFKDDRCELMSLDRDALNDRTIVENLKEHEICIQPTDHLEFLLGKYIHYDLKYLWRAIKDPRIPSYLEIANLSSVGVHVRQWGCSESINLHAQAKGGWLLQPNKPRLLQFATSLEDSAWSEGIDVFSDISGSDTVKSLATVLNVSFDRSEQLNVIIEDGILLYNSTNHDVLLRVNGQESCLPACQMTHLLCSDSEVLIRHSSGWSQKIIFDSESEVLSEPTHRENNNAFHLLVNKERSSVASYHICYPVTLTNLLNKAIKVQDTHQIVHNIAPMKSMDLFLPATGGKLCDLSVEESAGVQSELTTLYCPGYASEKSNFAIDPADINVFVPAPGTTSALLDRYVLRSEMTEYNTVDLRLMPPMTLQNSTDFHLELEDHINKLCVPPLSFAAHTAIMESFSVSIIIPYNGSNEVYRTVPCDVSFSKIDAIDAVSSDSQRSFRFVLDVQSDAGFSKIEIKPLYYITNNTASMIFDGFNNVYPPGSTRALLSPVDLVSGTVTVAQGRLRTDGTPIIIDNLTLSLGTSHGCQYTLGNLSYSVSRNGEATIFSITSGGQELIIKNLLSKDVSVGFLSRQNEMLRTFCILKGSSHVVAVCRSDHTMQLTSADWEYDVELATLNSRSIVDLRSLFLYKIVDTLELREPVNPIILSMVEVRLKVSLVSFKLLNNPWMEDRDEVCLNLEDIQCQWLSGLPSSLESLNFALQKYQLTISHGEKTMLECLNEALSFHCEMRREPVISIEYVLMGIGEPYLFIDDEIVGKMIEMGIGAKSAEGSLKVDCDAERDKVQLVIKMLQIRSLTINCDVHLSKSDWLPIAVDATRAQLTISNVDYKGERTLTETLSMLKEHIGDNLLRNAPYLVGSLQMLFDPVGLARSLRRGVVDFVRFPLEGLQRKSIVSFVSGLGYGSVAFLREISSWSIGATIGFSQTMIKMMRTSSTQKRNKIAMVGHCQRDSDIRTVRQVVYGVSDLEKVFAGSPTTGLESLPSVLWYRDVKEARLFIRRVDDDGIKDEKVSLRIAYPVLMIHTCGLVMFAHQGKTPSFHIHSEEFTYTFRGDCSVLIRSEQCRSFADIQTLHSSDIYIHFTPEDVEVIRHLLAMISSNSNE